MDQLAKKHKLLVLYMTLGEILPHNRSDIDSIESAILCRDRISAILVRVYHFFPLVKDLTQIILDDSGTLQGTMITSVGDNLGSHSFGGVWRKLQQKQKLLSLLSYRSESLKVGPLKKKGKHMKIVSRSCPSVRKSSQRV